MYQHVTDLVKILGVATGTQISKVCHDVWGCSDKAAGGLITQCKIHGQIVEVAPSLVNGKIEHVFKAI